MTPIIFALIYFLTFILEVSKDNAINFKQEDLAFLQDKIGDYMGSLWYEAVEFALTELIASKE